MLVEAALGLPIFLVLVFGIIEIGGVLKSYSSASNGVRSGGRVASVAGNDALADQMILERLAREASGLGAGEIEMVVVWHASGPGDTPPGACLPGVPAVPNQISVGQRVASGTGSCNVYFHPDAPGGAFDMATGRADQPPTYYFGCTGPSDPDVAHKVDCNWPGQSRKVMNSPRGASGPKPDHAGIYLRATHDYVTGILGDSLTITEIAVNLLEPQGYALTSP